MAKGRRDHNCGECQGIGSAAGGDGGCFCSIFDDGYGEEEDALEVDEKETWDG